MRATPMGIVYRNQRKYAKALARCQEALEIHKQLGNLLGQANVLTNIGLVYQNQGTKREAIAHLTRARALYLQYGFNPQSLQVVENSLAQLGVTAD